MPVQDAKTCRQRSTFSRIDDGLVVILEPPKIWGVFVFKFWGLKGLRGLWGLRGLCFQDTPNKYTTRFLHKYLQGFTVT